MESSVSATDDETTSEAWDGTPKSSVEVVAAVKTLGKDNENVIPSTTARQAMTMIAKTGATGYAQIFLYSSLRETGKAERGIHLFCDIHTNLMNLHGFMAGFQYIALDMEHDPRRGDVLTQVVYGLRMVGLCMSFSGVLGSLLSIEYLKSIIHEPQDLQVEGIMAYAPYFLLSDQLAVTTTCLLVLTINIMCYGFVPDWFCYTFNVGCAILSVNAINLFKMMIVNRQMHGSGRFLYSDPIWIAARKKIA